MSGPAITITIEGTRRIPFEVSVDFAPMIPANMPFPSECRWPRPGIRWPSQGKIDKILQIGICHVAKKKFYWLLSFAQCEKELMKEIDADGGCRKAVHRIMMKLKGDVWCPERHPVLSSCCLKVISE